MLRISIVPLTLSAYVYASALRCTEDLPLDAPPSSSASRTVHAVQSCRSASKVIEKHPHWPYTEGTRIKVAPTSDSQSLTSCIHHDDYADLRRHVRNLAPAHLEGFELTCIDLEDSLTWTALWWTRPPVWRVHGKSSRRRIRQSMCITF